MERCAQSRNLIEYPLLLAAERLKLAEVVMTDADSALEAEGQGTVGDFKSTPRVGHRASQHRIDVDTKLSTVGKPFKLLI